MAGTGGRPTKRKGEVLSKNRTFRVRDQLDLRLQQAAAGKGRSVSEEIEMRLEATFDADDVSGTRYAELQRWLDRAIAVLALGNDPQETDAAVAACLPLMTESFYKGGLTRERYLECLFASRNAPTGSSVGIIVAKSILCAAGMADWIQRLDDDEI